MFCLKCGAFIKEGQKFCKECSSPVNSLNEENTDIPSKNNKSQKQEQNSNLISLNCPNCGGKVSFDMENIIAYCPYCGSELSVDVKSLCSIIQSREETKRKQMEYEHLEKMKEIDFELQKKQKIRDTFLDILKDNFDAFIMFFLLLLIPIFFIILYFII